MPRARDAIPQCLCCFAEEVECWNGTIPGCCIKCSPHVKLAPEVTNPECFDKTLLAAIKAPDNAQSPRIYSAIKTTCRVTKKDSTETELQFTIAAYSAARLLRREEAEWREMDDQLSGICDQEFHPEKPPSGRGMACLCLRYLSMLSPRSVSAPSDHAGVEGLFSFAYQLLARFYLLLEGARATAMADIVKGGDVAACPQALHEVALLYLGFRRVRKQVGDKSTVLLIEGEEFRTAFIACLKRWEESFHGAIQDACSSQVSWYKTLGEKGAKMLRDEGEDFSLNFSFEIPGDTHTHPGRHCYAPSQTSSESWQLMSWAALGTSVPYGMSGYSLLTPHGSARLSCVASDNNSIDSHRGPLNASWNMPVIDEHQPDVDLRCIGTTLQLPDVLSTTAGNDSGDVDDPFDLLRGHDGTEDAQSRYFGTDDEPLSTSLPMILEGVTSLQQPWNHTFSQQPYLRPELPELPDHHTHSQSDYIRFTMAPPRPTLCWPASQPQEEYQHQYPHPRVCYTQQPDGAASRQAATPQTHGASARGQGTPCIEAAHGPAAALKYDPARATPGGWSPIETRSGATSGGSSSSSSSLTATKLS